jgi:hypothetical protein
MTKSAAMTAARAVAVMRPPPLMTITSYFRLNGSIS